MYKNGHYMSRLFKKWGKSFLKIYQKTCAMIIYKIKSGLSRWMGQQSHPSHNGKSIMMLKKSWFCCNNLHHLTPKTVT